MNLYIQNKKEMRDRQNRRQKERKIQEEKERRDRHTSRQKDRQT